MITYTVYLKKSGVYVEGVRCQTQEQVDTVIDNADEYEEYLVVVRNSELNMDFPLERGTIEHKTKKRKK